MKQLSIPKIAIEAGKMTEVVRDVIKGVQTSKQDVYEQKKEEFKPIREEIQKAVEEVSELRKDIANQIIPYSEKVQRLALKGSSCEESKMIFNMNMGFTPDELTIIQNKDLPLTGDVFLQTLKSQIMQMTHRIKLEYLLFVGGPRKDKPTLETIPRTV